MKMPDVFKEIIFKSVIRQPVNMRIEFEMNDTTYLYIHMSGDDPKKKEKFRFIIYDQRDKPAQVDQSVYGIEQLDR